MPLRLDRNLKSSMTVRPLAASCTGPGAPVPVTGIRSRVPLSVLEAHTAPWWNSTPLTPRWPGPDWAGARAWLTSHCVAVPPEAGPGRVRGEHVVVNGPVAAADVAADGLARVAGDQDGLLPGRADPQQFRRLAVQEAEQRDGQRLVGVDRHALRLLPGRVVKRGHRVHAGDDRAAGRRSRRRHRAGDSHGRDGRSGHNQRRDRRMKTDPVQSVSLQEMTCQDRSCLSGAVTRAAPESRPGRYRRPNAYTLLLLSGFPVARQSVPQ